MEEEVILNRILEDAENEAEKIIAEAKKETDSLEEASRNKLMKASQEQLEILKKNILKENQSEIEKEELLARNVELVEKSRAIEIVKERVKQKIRDLGEKEYLGIILNLLNKVPNKDITEIVLPSTYIKKVKEALKGYNVTESDDFDLGLIAKCGSIEYNFDLEENMNYMNEELDKKINSILF